MSSKIWIIIACMAAGLAASFAQTNITENAAVIPAAREAQLQALRQDQAAAEQALANVPEIKRIDARILQLQEQLRLLQAERQALVSKYLPAIKALAEASGSAQ